MKPFPGLLRSEECAFCKRRALCVDSCGKRVCGRCACVNEYLSSMDEDAPNPMDEVAETGYGDFACLPAEDVVSLPPCKASASRK